MQYTSPTSSVVSCKPFVEFSLPSAVFVRSEADSSLQHFACAALILPFKELWSETSVSDWVPKDLAHPSNSKWLVRHKVNFEGSTFVKTPWFIREQQWKMGGSNKDRGKIVEDTWYSFSNKNSSALIKSFRRSKRNCGPRNAPKGWLLWNRGDTNIEPWFH